MSRYTNKDITHKFDNQSRLGYSIVGKRGGVAKTKDDIGCVVAFIDNPYGCESFNEISVDAFHGSGDDYGRREQCEIVIIREGKEIFRGDFNALSDKLVKSE